jgi:hypothetical protein
VGRVGLFKTWVARMDGRESSLCSSVGSAPRPIDTDTSVAMVLPVVLPVAALYNSAWHPIMALIAAIT